MVLSISRERYRVSNQFYIYHLGEPVLVLLTDPSVLALTDGDPDVLGATRREALGPASDIGWQMWSCRHQAHSLVCQSKTMPARYPWFPWIQNIFYSFL